MKTYECMVCGWIYDEAKGCPEEGIPAGTRWQDVPDDWCCPACGASKGEFDMVAVEAAVAHPAATLAEGQAASLVIIGSGLAAYTLAREFRKIDSASSLVLVTRDGGGFYAKPSLSNALANHKTPAALQTRTAEQMAGELNADIRVRSEVIAIDAQTRQLRLRDGSQLAYGRLVIAWGADPIRLPFAGDGADDVQSVNDLDDYRRFHAGLEKARSVVVIGAGLIGCEFANDLASRQITASLVDPSAWPLSRLLPEEAGRYFTAGLQAKGVEFFFATSVKGIWQAASAYRVELADGRQLCADQILSAIGLRPRTAVAQAAGISCQRGIVTDRFLETDSAGIYAMGDCAEIAGLNLPFVLPIMHQAAALAKTLAGTPTQLCYPAMPVMVKTPACPTVVCPPAPGAEGSWQCQAVDGGLEALFQSPTGALLGFALLGKATGRSQELAARLPATLA
ncbi:MAG: putative rubredoxin reductase [Proteobacteria bacterium]|nr:putative rubredoxin reductase [Pseudomonadota bacterium]